MGLNAFEVVALHNNMLFTPNPNTSRGGSSWASEFPLLADNINGQLTRYSRLMGTFFSSVINSGITNPASPQSGSYGYETGAGTFPWRPFGGYFVRSTLFTLPSDGANNYRAGYLGSFVGAYGTGAAGTDFENQYGHDPNGSSVDFEPLYGHGSAIWPQLGTFTTMFRDSSSLPADGSAVISKSATVQTWSRTEYMPPIQYILWNANAVAQTIGSGNVKLYVETRPSLQIAGSGSHSGIMSDGSSQGASGTIGNSGAVIKPSNPSTSYTTPPVANTFYPYEMFNVTGVRKLNSRSMSLLFARIFDNGPNAYGWRYEEDGSDADGGTLQSVNVQTEYIWQRITDEYRVRNGAYFTINEEYYGLVMDTKCMIFSNKSAMLPLLFFDLVDTWGATNPRIAGVAVKTTQASPWQGHIYFLSENGALVDYDFTVSNGAPALKTAASAPSANEGYSSLQLSSDGLTLYALYGTLAHDPRTTTTGVSTPRVAVLPYTIGTDTWGALSVATVQGRINGRHLREMSVLRDGRMAILCEDTTSGADTSNALGTTNVAWQLMVYDPSAGTKWNATKINGNAGGSPVVSSTFSNMAIVSNVLTILATNTWSAGDVVTLGGITDATFDFYNGFSFTVLAAGLSGSQFSVNIPAHSNISAAVSAGKAYKAIQYGTDFTSFWFRNVNAHLHDVASNTVLIQGSWTGTNLFTVTLNSAGSTPSASSIQHVGSNSPATPGSTNWSPSVLPADIANVLNYGGYTTNGPSPLEIRHNRDSSNGFGDRTFFWANDRLSNSVGQASNATTMRMYYAAPSFNWNGTQQAAYLERQAIDAGNAGFIKQYGEPLAGGGASDWWYAGDITSHTNGVSLSSEAWTFPTTVTDNYISFLTIVSGSFADGGPVLSTPGTIYGRRCGQSICYLPTYWKWNGSAWVYADSSQDAYNNPKPIPNTAGTDVTLPNGLIVNYGTTNSSSYGANEWYTFCLCYGNTKMFRNARFPWAMFAGQTFLQNDTRNMSDEQALATYFVDTDLFSMSIAQAPVDPSAAPATVSNSGGGWATQVTWPKLNGSNLPYNGPLVVVLTAASFDPATAIIGSATANTWTIGSDTFAATASSTLAGSNPYFGFYGSPAVNWKAQSSPTQWLQIDLGTGPAAAKIPVAYSFRPYWNNGGTIGGPGQVPVTFKLEGSNTGLFSGEQTVLDNRSGVSPAKAWQGSFSNVVAFRYYRLTITATSGANSPALGMLQLYTAAAGTTFAFSDLVFFQYGSNQAGDGTYLSNAQFARGLTFEVSTNSGGSYSTIIPLWRAHNGYAYCFNRQTGVTNVRITCQSGWNYGTGGFSNTVDIVHLAFGPVYFFDWEADHWSTPGNGLYQSALNTARLGSTGATDGTPQRGSWDTNCLGVAVDAATLSIDGGSPSALIPMLQAVNNYALTAASLNETYPVLQMWDFWAVPTTAYKIHPFWGFVQFAGAGPQGALSTSSSQPGTSLSLLYHWGRRI